MSQRTALEQDTIDFARKIEEIFASQLELQREIASLLSLILQKLAHHPDNIEEFCLAEFGVNRNSILTSTARPNHINIRTEDSPGI